MLAVKFQAWLVSNSTMKNPIVLETTSVAVLPLKNGMMTRWHKITDY